MASVKAEVVSVSKRGARFTEKLASYAESLMLSLDRDKASRIHQARKEAREGKTVPLRSLMK